MKPLLITPPTSPVVDLTDLRRHLRVDHDEDDLLIVGLERSAVAHLDGWTGILGRCILRQTWQIDLPAGRHTLPFPDVVEAFFDDGQDTAQISVASTLAGPVVSLPAAGMLSFTCEMPPHLLPAAQVAVKMWVAEAYENRGTSASGNGAAFNAIVSALQWQGR